MAELSAAGDKFDAWENEPSVASAGVGKRPPLGGRPPVVSRGGRVGRQLGQVAGSARAASHQKRNGLQ